jgi:hypothetical protein
MHRLPGWVFLLGVAAVVLVGVGSERVLVASPAGDNAKQDVEEEARWHAARTAYVRQIERMSESISHNQACLQRHLLEHPGTAEARLQELRVLQEVCAEVAVALLAAETDYHRLNEMLQAGDFEPDGAVSLAIEQSPRVVEISGELRALQLRRTELQHTGREQEHPEIQLVDQQIQALRLMRDETYDQLARLHVNAAWESAAHRVAVLTEQASGLQVMLDEARARYEDQVRADADRAVIERALLADERRRETLWDRVRDLDLDADLDAAAQ